MEALAYQGILVTNCHTQIQGALERSLSHEHALLFAEPVYDDASDTIDWYTEASGKVQPLADLPIETQDQVRARIKDMAAEISAQAEELRNSLDGQRSSRGNILALALQFPGTENIFLVGQQPVIICWGFANGTYGAQPQDLVRLGAASAAKPVATSSDTPAPDSAPVASSPAAAQQTSPAPTPQASTAAIPAPPLTQKAEPEVLIVKHEWAWLSLAIRTLLLLLLLYLLAALLFGRAGCVMNGLLDNTPLPGFSQNSSGCTPSHTAPAVVPPAPQQPAAPVMPVPPPRAYVPDNSQALLLEEEYKRETRLRAELEALKLKLQQRAALCVPPPAPEPEEVVPPVEPPSLAEFMPSTPEETPPPPKEEPPKPAPEKPQPQPKPQPKPETPPQPPKKNEKMYIPEDAKKNNDLSFLEGCWQSDSPLFDTTTGKPIEVTYCFDANGRGTRAIQSVSYGRCVGPVRAGFGGGDGDLRMDADDATCAKGSSFGGHLVDCYGKGPGQTQCYGQERKGKRNKWEATFIRK